jgi:A/G-specific adenine glycosylase
MPRLQTRLQRRRLFSGEFAGVTRQRFHAPDLIAAKERKGHKRFCIRHFPAKHLLAVSLFTFRVFGVFRGVIRMTAKQISNGRKLVPALVSWFSSHARDLPWRRTRDPYAIWVSEIMLQQTQVNTVIPYWERWMRALPTIESAAKAKSAKLHKLWEGLGYYTRVRNLQRAAQEVVSNHGGKFPERFDDIFALPGVGRYTAGAICSIAFNQPKPILDGNVIRVLTRVFGITTDPREKQTKTHLWQLAAELVTHAKHAKSAKLVPENPLRPLRPLREDNACSHLNQSLMELGALICTPRSPNCATCPVQELCVGRKDNLQDQLPNLGKREATTERRFIAFVVERDGKFLARQRPDGVINAHLWEFPNVEVGVNDGRARHSVRSAASQTPNGAQRTDAPYQQADFRITSTKPLCAIKHSITRYRITLEAWHAELAKPLNTPGRWLKPSQLNKLAFTSAHKKILVRL